MDSRKYFSFREQSFARVSSEFSWVSCRRSACHLRASWLTSWRREHLATLKLSALASHEACSLQRSPRMPALSGISFRLSLLRFPAPLWLLLFLRRYELLVG